MRLRPLIPGLLLIGVCGSLMAQEGGQESTIYDDTIKAVHVEELKNYPSLPRQANIQGVVIIKAKFDSQGNVVSSEALSGHKLLVPEAISNSLKWRFEPNAVNQVIIVYDFRLEGVCSTSPPTPACIKFTFRFPNLATITAKRFPVNTESRY